MQHAYQYDRESYLDSPLTEAQRKQSIATKSNFSRKSKTSNVSRATDTLVKKEPSKAQLLAMIGGSPSPQKSSHANRNSKTPAPRMQAKPDRYNEQTPINEIRIALIQDGIR